MGRCATPTVAGVRAPTEPSPSGARLTALTLPPLTEPSRRDEAAPERAEPWVPVVGGPEPSQKPVAGWVPDVTGLPLPLPLVSSMRARFDATVAAVRWRPSARASVAVAAVCLGVAVLIVGMFLMHRQPASSTALASTPPTATGDLPVSSGSSGSTDASATDGAAGDGAGDTGSIVVDVGGHVRHPGLVTLPPGSRVADALAAAGGPLAASDIASLDLAAKVSDGELLLVGVPGAPTGGTGSDGGSTGPVDLNSATVGELDALPGVGPVLAQHIVDFRTAHDGFSSVSQLQQVPGIGPAKFAELKDLVTA